MIANDTEKKLNGNEKKTTRASCFCCMLSSNTTHKCIKNKKVPLFIIMLKAKKGMKD